MIVWSGKISLANAARLPLLKASKSKAILTPIPAPVPTASLPETSSTPCAKNPEPAPVVANNFFALAVLPSKPPGAANSPLVKAYSPSLVFGS